VLVLNGVKRLAATRKEVGFKSPTFRGVCAKGSLWVVACRAAIMSPHPLYLKVLPYTGKWVAACCLPLIASLNFFPPPTQSWLRLALVWRGDYATYKTEFVTTMEEHLVELGTLLLSVESVNPEVAGSAVTLVGYCGCNKGVWFSFAPKLFSSSRWSM